MTATHWGQCPKQSVPHQLPACQAAKHGSGWVALHALGAVEAGEYELRYTASYSEHRDKMWVPCDHAEHPTGCYCDDPVWRPVKDEQ